MSIKQQFFSVSVAPIVNGSILILGKKKKKNNNHICYLNATKHGNSRLESEQSLLKCRAS